MLRALHRKLEDSEPPYKMVVPHRTYLKKHGSALVPGKASLMVFDMLPTSYLFKKGHKIRMAISGADKDHFTDNPYRPKTIRLYRGKEFPSRIELPIRTSRH